MSPLAWFFALSGGFFWFLVVAGVVGSLLVRDGKRVPAAVEAVAPQPSAANVVPLHDPHHDPLTCRECLGADRGSF